MVSGDVCRVDDDTINTERFEMIVDPEAAISRFVGAVASSSREMALQVAHEHFWFGWLSEGFVLQMLCQNTDLPGVLADVDSDEQLLTGKVECSNSNSSIP